MPIRFATFAAVSSDRQAREEKASLADQVKTARAAGLAYAAVETAGPYILDGYSRTGYVNLSDALRDIPPLAEMLRAAETDQYDVLIMDNLERMGDLAPMLSTIFKRHRKQIFSARQSGRMFDPASYDPSADESADIMINVEGILQKYRLNKLRRGWAIGVPKRLEKGLPPFRVPYGYDRVGKEQPPIPNTDIKYIIQMKDWLLAGRPLKFIAEELTRQGVPAPSRKSPRWHVESIRHILLNPFYAGIVAIGQKRPERLSKKGTRYRQRTPQSAWQQGRGTHQPLWDENMLLAIQNEFARRMSLKNYAKTIYPLAGLLRCTVCKQKLIRRSMSRNGKLMPGLGCRFGNTHITLSYADAIQLLAKTLKRELQIARLAPPPIADQLQQLQRDLTALKEQRATVQAGYKAKIFNDSEASQQIGELERQEKNKQRQLDQLSHAEQSHTEQQLLQQTLNAIPDIATWITTDEPALVNQYISALCETIWVTPDLTFTITWRE